MQFSHSSRNSFMRRNERVYAYYARTYAATYAEYSPRIYKRGTEGVKFSGWTSSSRIPTRVRIYTSVNIPYIQPYIRGVYATFSRIWDRHFLVGIVSLHSQCARQGRGTRDIPIHISFRPPRGNGLSFRYD